MKHSGCILAFTAQRNAELIKAYKRAISSVDYIDLAKVSEIVVNTPCSRFWVSEERVVTVLSQVRRGMPVLDSMRPMKREMFEEISRRVKVLMEKNTRMSLDEAVMRAINSPAPKFYMVPRYAMEIIYRVRNGYYEKNNRYSRRPQE